MIFSSSIYFPADIMMLLSFLFLFYLFISIYSVYIWHNALFLSLLLTILPLIPLLLLTGGNPLPRDLAHKVPVELGTSCTTETLPKAVAYVSDMFF